MSDCVWGSKWDFEGYYRTDYVTGTECTVRVINVLCVWGTGCSVSVITECEYFCGKECAVRVITECVMVYIVY
jgi:hypothetical protein